MSGISIRFVLVLILPALVLGLIGCGDVDHGDRVPLVGKVTVRGQPLDGNGTIYFNPPAGQTGVGTSGHVSESRFEIPAESGPTPGQTYDVLVVTTPGIPAEGTPRKDIKLPQKFKTTVTLPARGADNPELEIAF